MNQFEIRFLLNSNENKERNFEMKKRKIFVRKLGKQIKEDDLMQYFSTFGQVETVEVLRNLKTQQSRRVAYVIFKNIESVELVFKKNSTHQLMGKDIECERCLLAEEINPIKASNGNNTTAYTSNISFMSNSDASLFMLSPDLLTPVDLYPSLNNQNNINSFSDPLRMPPSMIPCFQNNPIYNYANPQARSAIGVSNFQNNIAQNVNNTNTAPVNETSYNKPISPINAVNKIAAFKRDLKKQHYIKNSKQSVKRNMFSLNNNVSTEKDKEKELLISKLKCSDNEKKVKKSLSNIFSYRKNIKKRKNENIKLDQKEKDHLLQNEPKNLVTNDDAILNSSVIRKLSNAKFKEDIIESHKKSFFSSKISKCDDSSQNNDTSKEKPIKTNEVINPNDLVVDSVFFNNTKVIEKGYKDNESISSSEELLDLQINSSADEATDQKIN